MLGAIWLVRMALQSEYGPNVWSHAKVLSLLDGICRQILPQKEVSRLGDLRETASGSRSGRKRSSEDAEAERLDAAGFRTNARSSRRTARQMPCIDADAARSRRLPASSGRDTDPSVFDGRPETSYNSARILARAALDSSSVTRLSARRRSRRTRRVATLPRLADKTGGMGGKREDRSPAP